MLKHKSFGQYSLYMQAKLPTLKPFNGGSGRAIQASTRLH